ncbi:putative Histone-binding protein RBBP7 [Blattamonas nauphoetae]|uniref:Histone-binding protein RBBP7 n=1 Tax=Blattamonas nauphoetae TaxID=2049346 RepID=A0ABQ9YLU2_9EUKA|nr:putative Histone-binding protein RBBP7 [Blattamonas nauphoetae]
MEEEDVTTIAEEYKVWKKNVPFLYDICFTYVSEDPYLSCQVFPELRYSDTDGCAVQRVLLGSHSADQRNHIQVADIYLPTSESLKRIDQEGPLREFGGFSSSIQARFEEVLKIDHPTEVNRARFCPWNDSQAVTWATDKNLYLWDITNKSSKPLLKLVGHEAEGYGVDWNVHNKTMIVSSSDDGTVKVWDVTKTPGDSGPIPIISPLLNFEPSPSIAMEDCKWHPFHESEFGCCSDDKNAYIFDIRQSPSRATHLFAKHIDHVNSLSFSPFNEYWLATGSQDKTVRVWDMRNPSQEVMTLHGHAGSVYQVEWSPHNEFILVSSAADRRVFMWNLELSEERSSEDDIQASPQLLFIHGGHTAATNDIAFCNSLPFTLVSVSQDNNLQLWGVGRHVWDPTVMDG